MKLVSLNININKFYDLVFPFLKKENPDVFCLQELLEEDVEKFKNDFNYQGVFIPTVYLNHPFQGGIQNKRFGVGIFAKEILNSDSYYYAGSYEHIKLPFEEYFKQTHVRENGLLDEDRGLLFADVKINDAVYKIATTHFMKATSPQTPLTGKYEEIDSTQEQLDALDLMCGKLDSLDGFIFCGDLNSPRGNKAFTILASKYKDNIPVHYKTSIDSNLHIKKLTEPLMVDGLFTTPSYIASEVKLVDGVSDHMAIVANIDKI